MTEPTISMALDKSVRTIDQDGHLHVALSNISKANVCPYYGHEIPRAEDLGLQSDRIYNLYREPKALAKGASTFNGKPLQIVHKAQNAAEHDHKVVVGAVYNVEFNQPYLEAELVVWPKEAIDFIESNEQRELSCGYQYKAVMESGISPDGQKYDGWMDEILGNHVTIVFQGRAGSDVFVGDAMPNIPIPDPVPAAPPEAIPANSPEHPVLVSPYTAKGSIMAKTAVLSRQAVLASGALRAYLMPKMATDAKLDFNPILKPVTAKNWKASKPKIKVALDKALADKMAADADLSDLLDMLDQLEEMPEEEVTANAQDADPDEDDDEETKKKKAKEAAEKLKEAAADEDDESSDNEEDDEEDKKRKAKEAAEKLKEAAADRKGARDKAKAMDSEPRISKAAMDAAIASAVKAATRTAEVNTIARLRSIADAEKAVRPYIGELAVAQDSAEAVFKLALDAAGVDLEGVPSVAYAAMVKMLPTPGETKPAVKARQAMDSAALTTRATMFPNANRLSKH